MQHLGFSPRRTCSSTCFLTFLPLTDICCSLVIEEQIWEKPKEYIPNTPVFRPKIRISNVVLGMSHYQKIQRADPKLEILHVCQFILENKQTMWYLFHSMKFYTEIERMNWKYIILRKEVPYSTVFYVPSFMFLINFESLKFFLILQYYFKD